MMDVLVGFRDKFRTHAFVHLGWTIAVLIGVIILLVSVKVGSNDSIKDIINTALALASLILAILAIVQALISGGSLTDVISSLRSEISEIKEPAKSLEVAARLLTDRSNQIGESAKQFNDYLSSLSKPGEVSADEVEAVSADKDQIAEVLKRSNLGLRLTYYCCLSSFELSKPFIPSELFPGPRFSAFIQGAISLIISTQKMDIETVDNGFRVRGLGDFGWLRDNKRLLIRAARNQKLKTRIDKYFAA